jgi:hypothetical protein
MRKITRASLAVAALLATTLVAGTASAEPKGGGSSANSCSLGSTTYPEGTVVGLLKCKGGKWVLIVSIPSLPKLFL